VYSGFHFIWSAAHSNTAIGITLLCPLFPAIRLYWKRILDFDDIAVFFPTGLLFSDFSIVILFGF